MDENLIPKSKDYTAFNRIQQAFYTNINEFDGFSNFEIKQHAFTLLNNIVKGFPNLANEYINLYSPAVKTISSPAILKALQRVKFVNSFTRARVPNFIYFKTSTKKAKIAAEKIEKIPKGLIDFEQEIVNEIMELTFYDTKTYQYLKFTDKVQSIGKELMGQVIQKQELSKIKKSKK